tara:strand:+ start:15600 stop:16145 length:546 start_codon:yes stop_codon:yes gene_type:complete
MDMGDLEVVNQDWQNNIEDIFENFKEDISYLYPNNETETFLTAIWNESLEAFDKPREIQVVVDANDKLYISVGTPSFVSFDDQEEQLAGMTLPLKCWIHTHPFGVAFFSATDWRTVHTWQSILGSAIVLGLNEYMAYDMNTKIAKKVYYGVLTEAGPEEPAEEDWESWDYAEAVTEMGEEE